MLNLGILKEPQCVKVNMEHIQAQIYVLKLLLKEFKNIFYQTYRDFKGIPPKPTQHKIELDTIVPFALKNDIN